MSTPTYKLHHGHSALLISVPHVGTQIPIDQKHRYVARALDVEDTDWHLERLYGFARSMGAGLIVPRFSRLVIDLNRPPDNRPMYPGANNTELCPTRFFTGEPVYHAAQEPDDTEVAQRLATYWRPYHKALYREMARIKAQHGFAVLFDGHSIKSHLPWLFEGKLPDLNLGTVDGTSCAPSLREALARALQEQQLFTQVVDGRFKGGYITRTFGHPADGMHAVQLEMCWSTYMHERPPYRLDSVRAARLEPVLRTLVQTMTDWRPDA